MFMFMFMFVFCRKYILCDYLPKFDYKKEGILNSFLCGNILLVCVWLLWLPNVLPLIYCAWALNQWYNDGIPSSAYNYNSDLISYLFSMCIFVYISFFWVYSTLPRHMRRNNGYGSTYAAYYMSIFGLFYIHLIASDDTEASTTISTKNSFETPAPFSDDQTSSDPAENSVPVSSRNSLQIRTHGFLSECLHSGPFAASSLYIQRPCFGSDFTVGALLFALSSLIGSAFSLYDLYDRWPAPPAYVQGLASSFIFTIGAIIFWYASYPHRMQANDCDGSADIRDTFRCLFGGSNKDLDNSDGYTLLGNTSGKSTAA